METSSQRVENACHTPITVPSLLFPFFLVFYQKHHQGNQNRRWLEPDLCVPSQNSKPEGRCLSPNSWHLIFSLERKHGHLPWTPSMESVLTALSHVHVNHGPLGIETSCPMQPEQWQLWGHSQPNKMAGKGRRVREVSAYSSSAETLAGWTLIPASLQDKQLISLRTREAGSRRLMDDTGFHTLNLQMRKLKLKRRERQQMRSKARVRIRCSISLACSSFHYTNMTLIRGWGSPEKRAGLIIPQPEKAISRPSTGLQIIQFMSKQLLFPECFLSSALK